MKNRNGPLTRATQAKQRPFEVVVGWMGQTSLGRQSPHGALKDGRQGALTKSPTLPSPNTLS